MCSKHTPYMSEMLVYLDPWMLLNTILLLIHFPLHISSSHSKYVTGHACIDKAHMMWHYSDSQYSYIPFALYWTQCLLCANDYYCKQHHNIIAKCANNISWYIMLNMHNNRLHAFHTIQYPPTVNVCIAVLWFYPLSTNQRLIQTPANVLLCDLSFI